MTTYPFTPSTQANFQFGPTLDGSQYNAIVTWNVFGQRYYLNIYTLEGALVCSIPMVGSPDVVSLSSLTWASGIVLAETATPHGFTVNSVVTVTISGCTPNAYNGQVEALIVNDNEFQFDLTADPGMAVTLGTVGYLINLVGAYFITSSLVFYPDAQQIVVLP
jgi:hypothetical protein